MLIRVISAKKSTNIFSNAWQVTKFLQRKYRKSLWLSWFQHYPWNCMNGKITKSEIPLNGKGFD